MKQGSRVAIITGGATGIGFGAARVLAAKGLSVALAQPSLEVAQAAARRIEAESVAAVEVDLTRPDSIRRMVSTVMSRFGRIDVLVNSASITGPDAISSFLDCPEDQAAKIVDVNLKGTFHVSQAAARCMRDGGQGGSIVHISSIGAYAAQYGASLYCATKAAQIALAKSMALELAVHRIRVNCVVPGDIETSSGTAAHQLLQRQGDRAAFGQRIPLGRRGSADDIGHAVAYLVSDEASYVTGTTLVVDGGYLAG